ncbi:ribonuclease H-like domain-containing protein [Tanacetum coccineum]|uniref:Ribonuclease H-like domain-containing protein n=1 Tax=Tanacetum coccineum TaxID=301880 RepID=A0ABQ5AQW6_9ASTR
MMDLFNTNNHVGIKSHLNAASITAALIDVNVAQSKLVLLENFKENYSKCLRLLLKEFNLLKWDQQVVSELVTLRNFARRYGSRFCTHDDRLCTVGNHRECATLPKIAVLEGVEKVTPITSAEDKAQKRLEVKARSTLMMGIPNEHRLKFKSMKDAKLLLEAVEKRFGGNATTKKTQRNLLKQQYENFTAPRSEMLDQTFDRLEKLVSQLDLLDEKISQEDDLQQIHPDDIEEMDLRWKMAMLTIRARRFLKNTGRKLTDNGNKTIGFDKSKVKCYNCHKRGQFSKECRALKNQDNKNKEVSRRSVPVSNDSNCSKSCMETVKLLKSQNDQLLRDLEKSSLMVLGYKTVPPPYTGNIMPPTPDLSFTGLDEVFNKPVVKNRKFDEEASKVVRKSDDSLIIKD